MKKKLNTIPAQHIKQTLNPATILQLQLNSLPLVELEKNLYTEAEENPFLLVSPYYKKSRFFQKLDLEYQDTLQGRDFDASSSSLSDLKEELLFMKFTPEEKWVADTIISSILPNGMLGVSLDSIAKYLNISISLVQEVFKKISTVAPILESSENPIKSILKKIFPQPTDYNIAVEYWERLLEKAKYAKNTDINWGNIRDSVHTEIKDKHSNNNTDVSTIITKIDSALEELLLAQDFFESSQKDMPIVLKPDCIIEKSQEGKLSIKMGDNIVVQVKEWNPNLDAKHKKYYKEAQRILDSYKRRENLLHSLVELVVEIQSQYFFIGKEGLLPLSQKELATQLGVHSSTVSRLVRNKYFQYQEKILPISTLLEKTVRQKNTVKYSKFFIQQEIKKILSLTKDHKISDEQLRGLLENKDIFIARRTVNKYRREL